MSDEQRNTIIGVRMTECISCREGLKKLRNDARVYRSALAQATGSLEMAEGAGWDAAPLMMQRAAGIYPSADQLLNVAQMIKSESERLAALETELNNHGISLKDQN